MMILVTGCGRSGTRYTKILLETLGLDIGHEVKAKDGMVDWHMAHRPVGSYDIILHQVRNPLKVISSCQAIKKTSWDFICRYEPRIKRTDSTLLRAMKYWLYWNLQAEKIASYTYQIEKIDIETIASLLGIQLTAEQRNKIVDIPKDEHTRGKHRQFSFADLNREHSEISRKIMNLAKRYGYIF